MSVPIIIDCDPGHDDAIALMLAAASPEVEILGVTTVAGNTTLEKATANAIRVLDVVGRPDIPVVSGARRPLQRELVTAESVHGPSGLDGPEWAEPSRGPAGDDAVTFLAETILRHGVPVTLVPTGPLTNISRLLADRPEVRSRIERIVFMGGAIELGNWTPAAEFNIWVDPEAADAVVSSGLDVTMIGLEVTHQARLGPAHATSLRDAGRCGRFVADLLGYFMQYHRRVYGWDGAPIHDAVTVAALIDQSLVQTARRRVAVDTDSDLCRGRTVVDWWRVGDRGHEVSVGHGIDSERFARLMVDRLSGLP